MNKALKLFISLFLLTPFFLEAQITTSNVQKMTLICPLEHAMGREPKEAYTWNPPDQKVILISNVDSVVRSCIKSKVVKAEPAEDDNYELVINNGEHYFWYYGAIKPLVKRGQDISPGQAIATYIVGTELEFRMFIDEDMKDPRELLECKVQKAN
jgi:hypothetical protein